MIPLGRTKTPRQQGQEFPFEQEYKKLVNAGNAPKQAWAQLREEFKNWLHNVEPSKDSGQAWKSVSGSAFEKIVFQEFSTQVEGLGSLKVVRWKDIPKILKEPLSEKLWVRGEVRSVTVESNVDFVAYEVGDDDALKRIIAVYSCKVSLRERFQQDLFWAERLRGRGIRFCLITLDNDDELAEAAKTGDLSHKQVSMPTALYDRIYLFCKESEIQHYTRVFRTVDRLGEDLKRWLELD